MGLYWTVGTIVGGGGSFDPGNKTEYIFAMIVMVFGAMGFLMAIGTVNSFLFALDDIQAKLREKFATLEDIANEFGIDRNFTMRLRQALKHKYMHNTKDIDDLLKDLPVEERGILTEMMNKEITLKFDFFQQLPKKVLLYLLPLIKTIKRKKGEYIYEEGGVANSLFFISKGKAQMVLSKNFQEAPFITFEECKILICQSFQVIIWETKIFSLRKTQIQGEEIA